MAVQSTDDRKDAQTDEESPGCDACTVVGPLLTGTGTSGRSWRCACGKLWTSPPASAGPDPDAGATCELCCDRRAQYDAYVTTEEKDQLFHVCGSCAPVALVAWRRNGANVALDPR